MGRSREITAGKGRVLLLAAISLVVGPSVANGQSAKKASIEVEEQKIELQRHIHSLVFSPDGNTLAVGANDVHLIDMRVNPPVMVAILAVDQAFGVHALDFSPDGRFLAVACTDHSLRMWQMGETPQEVSKGVSHAEAVKAVAFSPDGRLVVSGGDDRTAILWNVSATGELSEKAVIKASRPPFTEVRAVAFNERTGRKLVTVNTEGAIRFYDLSGEAPRQVSFSKVRGFSDVSIALSPGGKRLAVSEGREFEILGYNLVGRGHHEVVTGLAFSPDAQSLASCGRDGRVVIWNTGTLRPRFVKERPDRFTAVAYPRFPSPGKPASATTLAAGTDNGSLYFFRYELRGVK